MTDKLGPGGKFPLGQGPDDKGELQVAIGLDDTGKVVIHFAAPITWVAMSPQQAVDFAHMIIDTAGKKRSLQ